jgi:hypothetical protein
MGEQRRRLDCTVPTDHCTATQRLEEEQLGEPQSNFDPICPWWQSILYYPGTIPIALLSR